MIYSYRCYERKQEEPSITSSEIFTSRQYKNKAAPRVNPGAVGGSRAGILEDVDGGDVGGILFYS